MQDFKTKYGPWALVAGASEGLGAAYAEALAKRGLNLILIARRQEKLESVAEMLKSQYPVEVRCEVLDLANPELTHRFISQLDVPIGLLVYNAAYAPIGYFKDIPAEDLAKIVEVNIKAPMLLVREVVPPMIERGKGGIILMSSLAGSQGSPKIATYAASKAFNMIFAEGLWNELKNSGVDVLATVAGAVATPGYLTAQSPKGAPGTLRPNQVVEEALNALGKGPTIIPGRMNRLARFFMVRLLPRKTAISIMATNTKDLT